MTLLAKNKILFILGLLGIAFTIFNFWDYGMIITESYPHLTHFTGYPPGGDFWQFWATARLVLSGMPEGPYQPAVITAALQDISNITHGVQSSPLYYPPLYLMWLAPFGLLPYFPAYLVFFTFGFLLLVTSIHFWCRNWRITSTMLLFFGIHLNLMMGQNGLITAALFGFALYFLERSPITSGIFFASLFFKPQLCILIPIVLLAQRDKDVFRYTLLAGLVYISVSIILFGFLPWIDSLSAMATANGTLGGMTELLLRNPSFFAFLRLSGLDGYLRDLFFSDHVTFLAVAMLLHVILAAGVVSVVVRIWRKCDILRLKFSALACGALLVTPFLYEYDQALMIWPILMLTLEALRSRFSWAEIMVLPLAMMWPVLMQKIPQFVGLQLGFVMPVILLILTWRRAKHEQKESVDLSALNAVKAVYDA